ncbi:hypothetical protein CE195_05710, partial [Sodalis-like symbiont of Philaenus spumarius]
TICFSRSVEIHEKVIGAFIEKHMFYSLESLPTAYTNSRLSAAVRPGSEAFPGKNELIRSYWSSLSINLGILFFRKIQNVGRLFYKITALGYCCQQALDPAGSLRFGGNPL